MDQHLPRILSTNFPPNPLETSALQGGINDLNSKITHLRSQVQELDRLEDQLRRYRAALSPIRRLPPEILGEVFRYVLPSVNDKDSVEVVELGLVCKGWREATFGVHYFWSHLTVHVGRLGRRYDETVVWMSRSGALPRTLHLQWDWMSRPHKHKCSKNTCRLSSVEMVKLLGNGPDIQHLILECQRPRCLQQLLDSLEEVESRPPDRTWDKIRSLDLIFGDDDEYWSQTQGPTAIALSDYVFSRLPPITSFLLSLPCVDAAFPRRSQSRFGRLDIPQALLERLTLLKLRCDWDGNHILNMLRQCPNLETLVFDTRYRDWTPRDPLTGPESLLLPKLQTLQLLHDGMFSLLNYIDTPELETLELRGDGSPNAGSLGLQLDPDTLSQHRDRLMQNLRVFRLYDKEFVQPFELMHVFSCLPALTHVKLDKIVVDWVTMWSGMPVAEEGSESRPCLQHLEALEVLQIKQEYAEEFFPALFGFIVERGSHPCELTVSFEDVSPPTYQDAERAWDVWKEEDEVSGKSLDRFGISLRVVPPVDDYCSEEEG